MVDSPKATEPLYSSLGGDPDLGEIVELFVEEMPGRMATVLGHFESGNWEELRRTAHQLRGAAGSYGFDPISPWAARLEECILGGRSEEEIRRAVEDLVTVCSRARGGAPG